MCSRSSKAGGGGGLRSVSGLSALGTRGQVLNGSMGTSFLRCAGRAAVTLISSSCTIRDAGWMRRLAACLCEGAGRRGSGATVALRISGRHPDSASCAADPTLGRSPSRHRAQAPADTGISIHPQAPVDTFPSGLLRASSRRHSVRVRGLEWDRLVRHHWRADPCGRPPAGPLLSERSLLPSRSRFAPPAVSGPPWVVWQSREPFQGLTLTYRGRPRRGVAGRSRTGRVSRSP
jgi:hypothetical protein